MKINVFKLKTLELKLIPKWEYSIIRQEFDYTKTTAKLAQKEAWD